jgi:probable rRNA maturation factor
MERLVIDLDVDEAAWGPAESWETIVRRAAEAALTAAAAGAGERRAVDIALVDDATAADLNGRFRQKPYATNVLSFPAAAMPGLPPDEPRPLGDIAIAAGVVAREAAQKGRPLAHHVSHLVIHAMLHLLGHVHETEAQAEALAALEVAALKRLDIGDPYADHGA